MVTASDGGSATLTASGLPAGRAGLYFFARHDANDANRVHEFRVDNYMLESTPSGHPGILWVVSQGTVSVRAAGSAGGHQSAGPFYSVNPKVAVEGKGS